MAAIYLGAACMPKRQRPQGLVGSQGRASANLLVSVGLCTTEQDYGWNFSRSTSESECIEVGTGSL